MRKIGFWKSSMSPELPMPVPHNIPFEGKNEFIKRLRAIEENKATKMSYRGFSICRICNEVNGSAEYSFSGFTWPSGYLHYIQDHNVIPEKDFFDFIMNDGKTAVKKLFGHITDGPSTTFLPDTLEEILETSKIDKSLITEIMATINAQILVAYNDGYQDAKQRFKK